MRKDFKKRINTYKVNDLYAQCFGNEATKEGAFYQGMMCRVRGTGGSHVHNPKYIGTDVSENMADYQFFVEWCRLQKGFEEDGWVLDKDYLSKDKKIYHEDTCVFIPVVMNSFITTRRKNRGLPLGVSWCESEGKFKAYCSQLNGKNKTLGRFTNPEDAFNAYKKFKKEKATELAKMYTGRVDERVLFILKDFDVEEYMKEIE